MLSGHEPGYREIAVEELGPGDTYGEINFFSGRVSPPNWKLVAAEPCATLEIDSALFKDVARTHHDFSYMLLKELARKVIELDRTIFESKRSKRALQQLITLQRNLPFSAKLETGAPPVLRAAAVESSTTNAVKHQPADIGPQTDTAFCKFRRRDKHGNQLCSSGEAIGFVGGRVEVFNETVPSREGPIFKAWLIGRLLAAEIA
jgi:hypothetical protein